MHRDPESNQLWIEMTFADLTDQEKTTFKRYLLSDGTVCIRKIAKINNGNIETSYNGWIEQPDEEWLRAENAGNYTTREKIKETPLSELVPESGRITKAIVEEAQQRYIEHNQADLKFSEALESGPLLGQKNVGGGVLPEFYLIPAVRDLTEEIKLKTTTTFGRLMNRAIQEMAERDPRFTEARTQLENVLSSLNHRAEDGGASNELARLERTIEDELKAWGGVKVNIEVAPPEMEKLFELGTNVHLDDGVRTTAARKGHGLQRAMMFALLRSWAATLRAQRASEAEEGIRSRKRSDSVVFAMEEPELFLHPHAQRRLSSSLREIAEAPQHQVFLCTHSTHFVDLSNYKEVAIISKEDATQGSCVRQCTEEIFSGDGVSDQKKRFHMAEWINPDRGEMFFARQVVFVEGETEKVAIPYLAEKLQIFDPDVSIIDCGSKHNIPLYVAIASAFQIPHVVIHDEDPLPDQIPEGWSEDKRREKERTYQLNEEIGQLVEAPLGNVELLYPDFEGAAGVSRTRGKKIGKALAALEHFERCSQGDVPNGLAVVVRAAYDSSGTA